MKRISFIALVTLSLITLKSYNQENVGYYIDINGEPINGFFSPQNYSPQKKLYFVHNSDSYEIGHYYDENNQKVDGLIKFENQKTWYKKSKHNKKERLSPSKVKSFVIGVDSFFVASNFYYKNKLKTDPEYVQFITKIDTLTIAKHYHFPSSFAQSYGIADPMVETFIVKSKNAAKWDNFPEKKKNLEKNILKYFGHIEHIKNEALKGEYDKEDVLSIIKMADYDYRYRNNTPIYFDKYWQELHSNKNAAYHAFITKQIDSIWSLSYYSQEKLVHEISYSSFYPNIKDGEFKSYDQNERVFQTLTYKNNKIQEVKEFNPDNSISKHYKYNETETEDEDETIDLEYITIASATENNILNNNQPVEYIYDSFTDVEITRIYKNNKIAKSYYPKFNDTVYQATNPEYEFKLKTLQKEYKSYFDSKDLSNAIFDNAQGIILVSFIVNKKGRVLEYKVINKLHPKLDDYTKSFIEKNIVGEYSLSFKFKPYKIGKEKVAFELVIPFEFSINRFYRKPVNYNNYHNHYWHHQHWHHQHMMQQMHHQHMQHQMNQQMNQMRMSMPRAF